MKILTFNLWHGLAPGPARNFVELEPEVRRHKREELQYKVVKSLAADLVFFQEVNPISERLKAWRSVLGLEGFAQPDLMGLKVRGWGWPPRLNSGLLTLVSSRFAPRGAGSVHLSGSRFSFAHQLVSCQFGENRYALMVEFLHPTWGRVLAVNCHFHHGLELTESLHKKILSLSEEGVLTANAAGELRDRAGLANARRQLEAQTLLDRLEAIKTRYSLIVLGGDLNCSAESDAYQMITKFGFKDLWLERHKTESSGDTFDHSRNRANHVLTSQYPLTVSSEDLSFSPKAREVVKGILLDHEHRARRIDYLLAYSAEKELDLGAVELIGPGLQDEPLPSDHFGVMAELLGGV